MIVNYSELAKQSGIYINQKHPIAKLARSGKDNVHPSAYDSLAIFYQQSITKALSNNGLEWSIEEGRKVIMGYLYGD